MSTEQGCQHTTQQGVNVNPTGGPAERSCLYCTSGSWTDSNGIQRRCHYCQGTGRVKA